MKKMNKASEKCETWLNTLTHKNGSTRRRERGEKLKEIMKIISYFFQKSNKFSFDI